VHDVVAQILLTFFLLGYYEMVVLNLRISRTQHAGRCDRNDMNTSRTVTLTKLFLIPWILVSAWACETWFFRIYERGFRYNPYVLEFEFAWSRFLLLGFGIAGVVFFERSRASLPGWSRALYLLLITTAAAVLLLDLIISTFVTPAI
jgi:hypothetical protein